MDHVMFKTVALTVGVGAAFFWGNEYWSRHEKDKTMLKDLDRDLDKSRQWSEAGVLASLVELVYCRDKIWNSLENLLDGIDCDTEYWRVKFWNSLESLVHEIDCKTEYCHEIIWKSLESLLDDIDTERREILLQDICCNTQIMKSLLYGLNYKPVDDIVYDNERLMVFGRVGDGPSTGNAVRWPKYVVAIRGTIFSFLSDLSQDFQILLQSLSPSAYKPVIDLLLELHRRCPGPDGVCVVGHSLGAAIALIATAELAIDHDIVLDTHLFNPPYFTLGVLCKKMVKGMASGLADGARNILGIGDNGGQIIRDVAKWLINKTDSMAVELGAALGPGTRAVLTRRYNTLASKGYRPSIYLNPHDPISNRYIEHFQGSAPRVSIAVLIWKNFVSHCASLHLIPLARVHTNHFAEGPIRAHGLDQWSRREPVKLTSRDAGV